MTVFKVKISRSVFASQYLRS